MEKNEVVTLVDRGFIYVNGSDAKEFLQSIVTNDIEKASSDSTIFSSIFTPQGKYLFDFFILKLENKYILECEKKVVLDIIKLLNFYKLRSKVNIINSSEKYNALVISLEKFKEINNSTADRGRTINYHKSVIYVDPRNERLGAKIVLETQEVSKMIKKLSLKIINDKIYYSKSFRIGIPQINLNKLKDKVFGIENNLDELHGIDFKKGCYIGQENTARIKMRNKLRRRVLPIEIINGEIIENEIIKYQDNEVGKILIDKPYAFAIVKVVDPELKEFVNTELVCGKSKIKILKPDWI